MFLGRMQIESNYYLCGYPYQLEAGYGNREYRIDTDPKFRVSTPI